MRRYRIAHGNVRTSLPDGERLLTVGEELDLDDATAQRLGDQVQLLPELAPAQVESSPAGGKLKPAKA